MRPDRDELACVTFVEMATDYLERSLSRTAEARVIRHLAGCDGCTTYLDQIRRTIEMARRLPRPLVEPAIGRRLADAARANRPRR